MFTSSFRTLNYICCLLLPTTASLIFPSQSWADPVKPFPAKIVNGHPLLGGWVEQNMQQMVRDCTSTPGNANLRIQHTNSLTKITSDAGEVTAVPVQIAADLALATDGQQTIFVNSDDTISREFGYVYTEEEQVSDQKNARYLDLNYGDNADQNISPGISGFVYHSSCANSLTGSLDASGGYGFGIATVKASLAANYEGSTAYSLNLVKGEFTSPIWAMYQGNNGDGLSKSGEEFFASVMFWDWYTRHPDQIGKSNYLLANFTGISLYKSSGSKLETKVTANVSAGVTAAVASANSSINGSIGNSTSFTGSSFKSAAFIEAGKPHREFVPLPAINAAKSMAESMGRFRRDAKQSDDVFLYDTQSSKKIVQAIAFLPVKYCDAGQWSVDNQNITLDEVKSLPRQPDGTSTCQFTTIYKPPAGAALADTKLDYHFILTFNGNSSYNLNFPADSTSFIARTSPRLEFVSGSDIPTVDKTSAVNSVLTWSLLYRLVDDGMVSDAGQINFGDVDFEKSCGQTAIANVQPGMLDKTGGNASAKMLQVIVTNRYGKTLPDTSKPSAWAPCTLKGTTRFSITPPGGTVQNVPRSFPDTVLQFPNKDSK